MPYDSDITGAGSAVTRQGSVAKVSKAGFYGITANLRCIDVPRLTLHMVQISIDNEATWNNTLHWSPHIWVSPETTSRQVAPITFDAYLPAGAMLRHVVIISAGTSRFGGGDAQSYMQTSMSVKRVG